MPETLEPLSMDLVRKLQRIIEEGDSEVLTQISTKNIYQACVTLEIDLPSKGRQATKAGRMIAVTNLKKFWGIGPALPRMHMRHELTEIRMALRALQYEVKQIRDELREKRGH